MRAALTGRDAPDLRRVFHEPLRDPGAITYRHDVFRDLEDAGVLGAVRAFGREMEVVNRRLTHGAASRYATDGQRWLMSAAETFGNAVIELSTRLRSAHLRSRGLSAFRDYLASYVESDAFISLVTDTARVKAAVCGVSYRLWIRSSKVTVTRLRDEPDYSAEVLATFEKFRQDRTRKHYEWRFEQDSDMNHVEAAILDRVARLQPDAFAALEAYTERHASFLDPTIARFDREARFYLAWIDLMDRVRRGTNLRFCYPDVAPEARTVEASAIFDLALAASLVGEGRPVVPNDLELRRGERIVLVSGPNQGGKTTFARAVGQLHHLARIGVPVPGERVRVPLVDAIFTHFERRERVEDLTSKLEDDLRRIQAILEHATPESLVIMNESFTSTTVADQLFIGRRVLRGILDRGPLCVIVTFLDELAALDPAIVSMVGEVDPGNDTRRTFRIIRRPPDGLAYAMAIAEKHRLGYASVRKRLSR